MGDSPSQVLAAQLAELALPVGRLKTGTPPRLDGRTIDWQNLEMQPGDHPPEPMSYLTGAITTPQIACGITHTTSSAGAMDALAGLITAPVQPWDALICTSTAVKDNVTRLLQAQVDYLQSRLGVTRVVLPLLPVIPLGIHTSDFAFSDAQKAAARAAARLRCSVHG